MKLSILLKIASEAFEKTALSPATRAKYMGKAINNMHDTYGSLDKAITIANSPGAPRHALRRAIGIDRADGKGMGIPKSPEDLALGKKILRETLYPEYRKHVL